MQQCSAMLANKKCCVNVASSCPPKNLLLTLKKFNFFLPQLENTNSEKKHSLKMCCMRRWGPAKAFQAQLSASLILSAVSKRHSLKEIQYLTPLWGFSDSSDANIQRGARVCQPLFVYCEREMCVFQRLFHEICCCLNTNQLSSETVICLCDVKQLRPRWQAFLEGWIRTFCIV